MNKSTLLPKLPRESWSWSDMLPVVGAFVGVGGVTTGILVACTLAPAASSCRTPLTEFEYARTYTSTEAAEIYANKYLRKYQEANAALKAVTDRYTDLKRDFKLVTGYQKKLRDELPDFMYAVSPVLRYAVGGMPDNVTDADDDLVETIRLIGEYRDLLKEPLGILEWKRVIEIEQQLQKHLSRFKQKAVLLRKP